MIDGLPGTFKWPRSRDSRSRSPNLRKRAVLALFLFLSAYCPPFSHSFTISSQFGSRIRVSTSTRREKPVRWSTSSQRPDDGELATDFDLEDHETILKTVKKQQLQDLCHQFQLSAAGTKDDLLRRLRSFATEQADLDRERYLARAGRVEQGSADTEAKERYEVVSGDAETEEEDFGVLFVQLSDDSAKASKLSTPDAEKKALPKKKESPALTPESITAPPPPVTTNEKGERVVTVYNSADQNDLTGVAAAQPGQTGGSHTLDTMSTQSDQPWDPPKRDSSSADVEQAKESIVELVQVLLAMSGAPAYTNAFGDDLIDKTSIPSPLDSFVGFNPAKVPTELLRSSSQALRTGHGELLQEVLRQFELQAIGKDGMAGDDVAKGGGHYKEVSKVRAFLEGYRRAEVHRLARDTTALLLDKLVGEGLDGLDMTLATMARTSGETAAEYGELNDSLLEYLNDAIREQEKRVGPKTAESPSVLTWEDARDAEDRLDQLWNVTMEDGERVASLDPSDPRVQQVLEEQRENFIKQVGPTQSQLPESGAERLLLLLKLLRERIKVEAAFAPDEKGRNLRLLAYCMQLDNELLMEELLLRDLGNSLDRIDSFLELTTSSIEYGESTSYQLSPMKSQTLQIPLLQRIHRLTEDFRRKQVVKASGIKS